MQRIAEAAGVELRDEWGAGEDVWGPELIEAWIYKAARTNAVRWAHGVEKALAAAVLREDPAEALRAYLDGAGPSVQLGGAFATEAASFGRHDAAKKVGLDVKTWRVQSATARPEHAALDGVKVGIDDLFENGLRWPGDFSGNSAESAACSCRLDYGREL